MHQSEHTHIHVGVEEGEELSSDHYEGDHQRHTFKPTNGLKFEVWNLLGCFNLQLPLLVLSLYLLHNFIVQL